MEINENVNKEEFRKAMEPAIKGYLDPTAYEVYQEIVKLGESM